MPISPPALVDKVFIHKFKDSWAWRNLCPAKIWHILLIAGAKKEERESENGFSLSDDLTFREQLDVSTLLQDELKKENLGLLSEKNLIEALSEFVDKQENEALSE